MQEKLLERLYLNRIKVKLGVLVPTYFLFDEYIKKSKSRGENKITSSYYFKEIQHCTKSKFCAKRYRGKIYRHTFQCLTTTLLTLFYSLIISYRLTNVITLYI